MTINNNNNNNTRNIIIIIISIQLFIYLHAELNSQWSITESARIQTAIRQHRTKHTKTTKQRKMDQLKLFKLKHGLLKISVDLQTAFAADTHLAEGQWLKEQLNVVKLRMFPVGTRRLQFPGQWGNV
jgi:hypothetical protein